MNIGEVGLTQVETGIGIDTVDSGGIVRIEGNHVIAWGSFGIRARGTGKTPRKNHVSTNGAGIDAHGNTVVVGNVVTDNALGVRLSDAATASGNATMGNKGNGFEILGTTFTGTIEKNDISGNGIGLFNEKPGLIATNNYWGSASGPGPTPAVKVFDFGGSTTATPFATKPFGVKVTFT